MSQNRKLFFLTSLLVLLALMLASCGAPAAPGASSAGTDTDAGDSGAAAASDAGDAADSERARTAIFDIDGGRVVDPENWNPFTPGRRLDHGYHQAMIEPLFILNYESGEMEPWMGETFESNEDATVWTLKLREGIEWSDGEAFNADDVVFSVEMLKANSPELAGSSQMAQWVDSVEKIDDVTIQFNLTEPNPRFQLDHFAVKIWGSVNIVPEHIWADVDPLTFKNYDPAQGWPVFTGPYTLDTVSETEFAYVRNDDWWGAKSGWKELPKPEVLLWTWAGPEETRTALMADAQLDSLMDITLGAFLALQAENPNVIAWFAGPPFAWLDPCSRIFQFNHTVEPWGDPEMRWAINHAIDRDQIVQIAYENTTLRSEHFFPAYPPLNRYVDLAKEAGLYDKYPLNEFNPDKTKEILESKGYTFNGTHYEKDGEVLSLDITTHEAFIEKQRIAQVVVEQLQNVGIDAVNRNEAGGTWGDNRSFGNFESQMGWQSCGSINEPWASMDTFNTRWLTPVGERANNNHWRWDTENAQKYSALVDEIGTLPLGDPKIDELFVEAMEHWLADLPIIPITQAKKLIPFDNTYWTNWPDAENNYLHSTTWWQSTHKIIHELEPAQ